MRSRLENTRVCVIESRSVKTIRSLPLYTLTLIHNIRCSKWMLRGEVAR
jgi:hypothetical protein